MHFDKYLAWTGAGKDTKLYQENDTDGHVWVEPNLLSDFLSESKVIPSQVTELEILFRLADDKLQ